MPGPVLEVFEQVIALAADERATFLDEACAGDDQLRTEVEALLRAHEAAEGFMESPTSGATAAGRMARHLEGPGTVIGPYKLVRQIGEGGMGVVYLAEQTEPVRRRVALKIIKAGMDTKAVVTRFEAERQALALMDHPCVAKVLDAGVTDTSRPYFVMEYVAGVPITEHCDTHRLSIDDRLALFMRVCDAVQHAHQKGIIHRDLKPSNILVSAKDSAGEPKVIDFGVAKALHQKLSEQTIFTEQGQLIGTPEYMSPEQAEMSAQDIDTRSDIYSLGVLLYELLTGERPFSSETLRRAGLGEIQRIIREEDPPKPSTRLSALGEASTTHARSRRVDPGSLRRSLKGDLDWIVMKALEKDRARRYETANGLAADLKRHLADEPVIAGPPSAKYRIGKFVKRNRLAVTAAAVVVVVLLAGITGTTWGLVSAQKRAEELEQVAEFQAARLSAIDVPLMAVHLRRDVLAEARQAMERANPGAEEIEDRAVQLESLLAGTNFTDVALHTLDENVFGGALVAVDEQFADQPLVRARLLQTVASILERWGLLERATRPRVDALAIRRRLLGDDHPDTLESISGMGVLLWSQGKLDEADRYLREALEGRRRVLGDDHPDTLESISEMGGLLKDQGKLAEVESYYREALAGRRRVLGDAHPQTLTSINNMGELLHRQGKLDEAESYFRESLEGHRRVLGDEHPETLNSIQVMGDLVGRQGRLDESERYKREALAGRRRVLGDEHPQTLTSINNMGTLLRFQGKLDEAESLYREAAEVKRRTLGDEHHSARGSIANLCLVLNALGRYAESESLLRGILGANDWRAAQTRSLLGEALAGLERFDEAEALLLQGHTDLETVMPPVFRSEKIPLSMERLIKLYDAWGKPEKADEWRAKLAEFEAALAD